MIPQGGTLKANQVVTIELQPSYTYRLDFTSNRLVGMTDDTEAIKQAVYKILQTEKYNYPIYTNYGVELADLLGKSRSLINSELKRRIKEALLHDDRIMAIEDIQITFDGDQAIAEFTVVTQYGSFSVSQGVGRNV